MKEPVWVLRETVLTLQEQLLAEFGGSAGIRDEGLLDSARARPKNLFAHKKPDLFEIAASCGFGLVKNHPFVDGNKRVGLTVAVLFLELNGWYFRAREADAVVRTLALAAGKLTEAAYAAWLKANATRA